MKVYYRGKAAIVTVIIQKATSYKVNPCSQRVPSLDYTRYNIRLCCCNIKTDVFCTARFQLMNWLILMHNPNIMDLCCS